MIISGTDARSHARADLAMLIIIAAAKLCLDIAGVFRTVHSLFIFLTFSASETVR